jgi:hypothetical protein
VKTARYLKTETNSTIWNHLWKEYLEMKGEIKCSRCPWHRSENWTRDSCHNNSWKSHRRRQMRGDIAPIREVAAIRYH